MPEYRRKSLPRHMHERRPIAGARMKGGSSRQREETGRIEGPVWFIVHGSIGGCNGGDVMGKEADAWRQAAETIRRTQTNEEEDGQNKRRLTEEVTEAGRLGGRRRWRAVGIAEGAGWRAWNDGGLRDGRRATAETWDGRGRWGRKAREADLHPRTSSERQARAVAGGRRVGGCRKRCVRRSGDAICP